MNDPLADYLERKANRGVIRIEAILPEDDGGTGQRWYATWGPDDDHVDIDSSAETLEAAIMYLAYGIAEEVLRLRNDRRSNQDSEAL